MSAVISGSKGSIEKAEVDAPLPDATQLAIDRTRLAFERTMMAWVRTATSLITFGFTVYKFFQFEKGNSDAAHHLMGPRGFALMMISIGIVSLLFATVQHRQNMKTLRVHYREVRIPLSLAALVSALIALLGIFALSVVILRR
jgi:putative membrane protein